MSYSESVIGSARMAHDASSTGSTSQTTLFILVQRAILAACGTGAFSCTASISGATSVNLQALLETLHTSGFSTSISSTTLTVSWN